MLYLWVYWARIKIGKHYCKVKCHENWSDGITGWEQVTRAQVNLGKKSI